MSYTRIPENIYFIDVRVCLFVHTPIQSFAYSVCSGRIVTQRVEKSKMKRSAHFQPLINTSHKEYGEPPRLQTHVRSPFDSLLPSFQATSCSAAGACRRRPSKPRSRRPRRRSSRTRGRCLQRARRWRQLARARALSSSPRQPCGPPIWGTAARWWGRYSPHPPPPDPTPSGWTECEVSAPTPESMGRETESGSNHGAGAPCFKPKTQNSDPESYLFR